MRYLTLTVVPMKNVMFPFYTWEKRASSTGPLPSPAGLGGGALTAGLALRTPGPLLLPQAAYSDPEAQGDCPAAVLALCAEVEGGKELQPLLEAFGAVGLVLNPPQSPRPLFQRPLSPNRPLPEECVTAPVLDVGMRVTSGLGIQDSPSLLYSQQTPSVHQANPRRQ